MTQATLRTDRLLLRPWEPQDAPALYAVLADDEVWPWLGATPQRCPDVEAAARTIARWSQLADGPLGIWAIEAADVADPTPCGSALVVPLPRSDGAPTEAVEIGWHLHPAAWGRGYATEAALALVDRVRDAGLPLLHAVVREGNDRSMAVCDRLGMTRLGPTQEWYGTEFVDHVLRLG